MQTIQIYRLIKLPYKELVNLQQIDITILV